MEKITGSGMYLRTEAVRSNILHISAGVSPLPERIASDFIRQELPVWEGETELFASAEEDGALRFCTAEGGTLLAEKGKTLEEIPVCVYTAEGGELTVDRVKTVDGERSFVRNLKCVEDHRAYRAVLDFYFGGDERIYGFGQGEDGILDKRHHTTYLYQHNMRIPMPCFLSSRGYGVLVNCGGLMIYEETAEGGRLTLDCVPYLDYYLIFGPSADRIVEGFRHLTGKAALLPRWAFGYIQSKEQYYSAKELAGVAAEYRRRGIPLDGVVQDWNSWRPGQWGEKRLDPDRYSDMEERAEELRGMHVHAMVSIWPNMNQTAEDYRELYAEGKILNDFSTYDAFDERAREIYWQQAKRGLFDRGFDAWWCDSTEPFSGPDWNGEEKRDEKERYELVGGEHVRYLPREKANLFALAHARGIYENQRKETREKRVLNLTRSGYASGQKYGALLWSGDTAATWETMRQQIVEGLSMGLSGYPWWTLDAGAFFVVNRNWKARGCGCSGDPSMKWFWRGSFENGIKDPAYREYYVRFLELACFLPVFRSHGTDAPREIWNFGEPGGLFYEAVAETIRLRYRLLPYIYSLAGAVRQSDFTMMRALLFDFPEDLRACGTEDEFMFGRGLLVCPVTEPLYYLPAELPAEGRELTPRPLPEEKEKARECYLPKAADGGGWYDFWTGRRYEGGQAVMAAAPLCQIPLFVPEGTILPEKEGLQYADDGADAPLEIHVFPGKNGSFLLYGDEGDGYRYESGAYAQIPLTWTEETGTLLLGDRRGSYPGMRNEVTVRLYLVNTYIREEIYDGRALAVRLSAPESGNAPL